MVRRTGFGGTSRSRCDGGFCLHVLEIAGRRCVYLPQEQAGIETHQKYEENDRAEDGGFPFRQVRQAAGSPRSLSFRT